MQTKRKSELDKKKQEVVPITFKILLPCHGLPSRRAAEGSDDKANGKGQGADCV